MSTYNYKANLDPMNLSGINLGKKTQADAINEVVNSVLSESEIIRKEKEVASKGLVSPRKRRDEEEEDEDESEGPFSSTVDMLKTFFDWNDKYTTEAKPRDETEGLEVTFDPPPEAHAKGVRQRKSAQSLVEPMDVSQALYSESYTKGFFPTEENYVPEDKELNITDSFTEAKSDKNKYGVTATKKANRNKIRFNKVVFHWTDNLNTTKGYIKSGQRFNKARDGQFGYHFYIDPDGTIYQGAPLTSRTNHVAGPHRQADAEFNKDSQEKISKALLFDTDEVKAKRQRLRNTSKYKKLLAKYSSYTYTGEGVYNENSIGISLVGAGGDNMKATEEQVSAATRLAVDIKNQYKLEYDDFTTHGLLPNMNRNKKEGLSALTALKDWEKGLKVSLRPRLRNLVQRKKEG